MTAATLTITDFLEQRLAEDEAAARAALIEAEYAQFGDTAADALLGLAESEGAQKEALVHFARHDPARVLAECATRRAIVELHSGSHECPGGEPGGWTGDVDVEAGDLCPTLRLIAAIYAGHADYREEWAA